MELHEEFADIFYVVQGKATLLTGGSITGAKTVETGEVRGLAVTDGERTELAMGDVVHIPAGLAHQLLLGKTKTFAYLVIKVEEK